MFAIRKTRCGKCRPCWERRKYAEKSSHVPVALVMATHIWSGTRKEWEVLRKRLERLRDRLGRDAVFPNVKVVQGNDRYFAALSLEAPPELLPTDLGIVAVTREEAARAVASVIDAIPEFGLRKGTHLVRGSDTWVFPDQPPPEPKKASEWRNMTEAPAAILCGDFDEVHRIIEQRAIHVRREEDVSLAVEDSIEFSLPIGSEREVFRSIFGRSWEGLPGGPDPDDGGPFGDPNFWSEPNPRQEALV